MIDNLSLEIIKRIFQHVGVNPPNKRELGLYSDFLKTEKVIESTTDDNKLITHSVFAGEINVADFSIKGCLIDLSIEDDYEFCFCWQAGSNSIFGVHCLFGDADQASFRMFLEKSNVWENVNMYNKAMMLAAWERMTSTGLLWNTCQNFDALYKAAIQLIS